MEIYTWCWLNGLDWWAPLIPGGIDSACHPSELVKMSASMLVYRVGAATRPELSPIAKETALAAPTLCTEYGPDGWMDGWMEVYFMKESPPRPQIYDPKLLQCRGLIT